MKTWVAAGCCALMMLACDEERPSNRGGRDLDGDDFDEPPFPVPGPDFLPVGDVVTAEVPPPAIQGGTLLWTNDGLVVASDPDRDTVFVVDPAERRVRAAVELRPGDEPGRLVEDDAGQVHVALRRGGAVVTIDPRAGVVLLRRAACPAPSGIAYADGELHVACATGELVTWDLQSRAERKLVLDQDLRDVVVYEDRIYVSRFRSAEVLVLDREGELLRRLRMPNRYMATISWSAQVAWQMRAIPHYGVWLLHQQHSNMILPEGSPYYGATECTGLVSSALTRVDGPVLESLPIGGTLVTDFDMRAGKLATAVTGDSFEGKDIFPDVLIGSFPAEPFEGCAPQYDSFSPPNAHEVTAVAWPVQGSVIVQTRSPAAIQFQSGSVLLSDTDRRDTGHALFHANTATGLACASCHPGGGDDGHVWKFSDMGPRRTQSLAGTLAGSAPYHWDGQLRDMSQLVGEVFVGRMRGYELDPERIETLRAWLVTIPRPVPASRPAALVAAGRSLFEDPEVGCVTCHGGAQLTSNLTVDVGTGGALQAPSLIGLGRRAPFMHDGCAATLSARFDPECGGHAHGNVDHLRSGQLDALITFLETL